MNFMNLTSTEMTPWLWKPSYLCKQCGGRFQKAPKTRRQAKYWDDSVEVTLLRFWALSWTKCTFTCSLITWLNDLATVSSGLSQVSISTLMYAAITSYYFTRWLHKNPNILQKMVPCFKMRKKSHKHRS